MTGFNEIKVLFEDDEVIAVNKPAGLLVHADGTSNESTLVDWITHTYPEINNVGEPMTIKNNLVIDRPGVVHRLDRDTSGIMLIAKTQISFENLKYQFKNRSIKKAYLAIVHGNFKDDKDKGVIDLPIGRSPKDFRRWSAQPGARGNKRSAKTEYYVLEQVPDYALVFLQPLTGRTHQLRVHLKAIHHPIVSDDLYGVKKSMVSAINRQALHARAITWQNLSGDLQQIIAPLADDFAAGLVELGFKYQ